MGESITLFESKKILRFTNGGKYYERNKITGVLKEFVPGKNQYVGL